MANNEDKKKALDAAIAKLEKDFGKGTVMKLGDPAAQVSVETIPTGSLSLDIALGLGGVPRGRVVEIEADYTCFTIPNEFVVGYGLDYDENYRNLPYVGVLKEEVYSK